MFTFRRGDSFLKKTSTIALWVIGGIILAALFGLIVGLLVQYLWNWLMPAVFGLGTITFWQAFGIVLLSKILFGSFGGHGRDDCDEKKFKLKFMHHRLDKKQKKYYSRFWKEEGETAFNNYIERIESQSRGDTSVEGKQNTDKPV
jgi:hypothetical protein